MLSPNVKLLKQQPRKKKQIDEGLRELRGIAVKIEPQEKPGDQFKKLGNEDSNLKVNNAVQQLQRFNGYFEDQQSQAMDSGGFGILSVLDSNYQGHQMVGPGQNSQYPAQSFGGSSNQDDRNSYMMHYAKSTGIVPGMSKASPRFSEANPQVGQLMQLNNRLSTNVGLLQRPSINMAFGIGFDGINNVYETIIETDQSRSDFNTASSKFATVKHAIDPKIPSGRTRNAQSQYHTAEFSSPDMLRGVSQRNAQKIATDSVVQKGHMALSTPPKIVLSQAEQQALRVMNPQAQKFENFMSKVVRSVQN